MTYIEFFDGIAAENISACLTYVPDRVVYIGDDTALINAHIENYKKVFSARGYNVEFIPRGLGRTNLDCAVELFSELVETYDDCVFDITGGEELYVLALGIVYSKYPDKNIQIHKFNLKNNRIYDFDKDGKTIYRDPPKLSVDENVKIYGGEVAYGEINEEKTYKWKLTPDFLNDIELMWSICRTNVRYWNTQIGIFEAIENVGHKNGLTTTVSRGALENYLTRHRQKYIKAKGIINYLLNKKLITKFDDENETTVTVSYKNEQVKKCLTKAGQALEMKVYVMAKNVRDKNGELVYDDAVNGVVIDWDGEFHDEKLEGIYDTENEIDILLMHKIVPVFISCKNGIVTNEELYKLNTVAERFGGSYAKRVLIATSLDSLGEAGKYIRQRAKDMDITLVENIQSLSDAEINKILKNLWNK